MTRKICAVLIILLSQSVEALVPVEGLILGQAINQYQTDPLALVFQKQFDTSKTTENVKVLHYRSVIQNGEALAEDCGNQAVPKYATSWDEKQALRSITATAQYIGLDLTIKAIGAYASKLSVGEEEFSNLATNLITNYCSQNLTVYSLKLLKASLLHSYKHPLDSIIPQVESSPFASHQFKNKTSTPLSLQNEMNIALKSFRSFCSWGNDVSDYRLLAPYLKNKFFMSQVINNMSGIDFVYNKDSESLKMVSRTNPIQVTCDNLICRKSTPENFSRKFPKTIGSTGEFKDLKKLYCHHFRFQDYKNDSVPQIKKWIKESELEDPIFETGFIISLMTGVPDPIMGMENYSEISFMARSSFEQRWSDWSMKILSTFSKDLLFEESIKIRPKPRRDKLALQTQGFGLNFTVTLGELDRVLDDTDKFKTKFNIKLSKGYLRLLRIKWTELTDKIDNEGQALFKKDIASYIQLQIKDKEKLFAQKMWNDDFSRLIAEEILAQAITYKSEYFESYKDEMLSIPVNFSYGVFALGYLRYRSDINAGRVKLNL